MSSAQTHGAAPLRETGWETCWGPGDGGGREGSLRGRGRTRRAAGRRSAQRPRQAPPVSGGSGGKASCRDMDCGHREIPGQFMNISVNILGPNLPQDGEANVGGAASAPIVASAFDSALAPVGVLMAVLGYALGTYGAWACALLMQAAS